jgi:hypothetical protein
MNCLIEKGSINMIVSNTFKQLIKDNNSNNIIFAGGFQSDLSGGYPLNLYVDTYYGTAWIQPEINNGFYENENDLEPYWKVCAEWGFRYCNDEKEYEELLHELGADAEHSCKTYNVIIGKD